MGLWYFVKLRAMGLSGYATVPSQRTMFLLVSLSGAGEVSPINPYTFLEENFVIPKQPLTVFTLTNET